MRILVADDDALSRTLLARTLERAGYEVTIVENGRLAAELLCRSDGPRLALLDWVMPELDGPGVCREVRQRREQPYVHMVLLTSRESKQDIVEGLESGADDYMIKPCDAAELKARLRTGLRILQLEDKLVEAREDMRFKATHDPLTGLFNRGVIVDLLARELVRTDRQGSCTTVLLGDVDHFKNINDTCGHAVGDKVLKDIALRILGAVRSYDYVGRYGGEEFLVVLNNCDESSSLPRGEQIRRAIGSAPVQTALGPIPVTMSLGVLATKDWEHRSAEEILHEVDAALYKAKADGRDCVRFAKSSLPPKVPIPVMSRGLK
jgi:two-component system, cell cycle response regulator